MNIRKVLKHLKVLEKVEDSNDASNKTYPTSKLQGRGGFHAKKNSQKGAERQRSMGNRMNKPPK